MKEKRKEGKRGDVVVAVVHFAHSSRDRGTGRRRERHRCTRAPRVCVHVCSVCVRALGIGYIYITRTHAHTREKHI